MADPEGIVLTFLNPRYGRAAQARQPLLALSDSEGIFADGDNEQLNLLKLRQIGFADMVILNKTDRS